MAKFKVYVVGQKKADKVEAEYVRMADSGALIFRNTPQPGEVYPKLVKQYAPGKWVSVETVDDICSYHS